MPGSVLSRVDAALHGVTLLVDVGLYALTPEGRGEGWRPNYHRKWLSQTMTAKATASPVANAPGPPWPRRSAGQHAYRVELTEGGRVSITAFVSVAVLSPLGVV